MAKNKQYLIKAKGESEAELLVYGDIGESWWGESVTAKETAEQLSQLEVDKITVRINSYGGSVSDGLAIFNALRNHKAAINVRVDGVAVSIASLIAMAGDTVEMAENALFMVHAPWGGAVGNSKELREYADVLDTYAMAMASSYVRKSGQDHDTIMALLTDGADHWYTAAEANDFGFVDNIIEEEMAAAAGFNKSKFAPSASKHHKPKAAIKSLTVNDQIRAMVDDYLNELTQPAALVAATIQPNLEEVTMTLKTKDTATEPTEADIQAAQTKAVQDAMAAESTRKTSIHEIFNLHKDREGVAEILNTCLLDSDITLEQAQAKLLAKLGEGAGPIASDVRIDSGETAGQKFAKGAEASLLVRANLGAKDDTQNEFRGYSLMEMARHSLAINGVNTNRMDKMSLVAAAFTHTSSDFTNLLANIANKAMLKGYDEAEETFQLWTNTGELPDFKQAKRVDLNAFPALTEVRDGGEYKTVTVGDRGETIQLATYGKLFSMTRQTIINDDLGAFTRIPMKMGRAAIRTVGDLVYAILTGNPNMSDGTALFHADHSNLLTGAVISTASVDAMRVAMAKQKDGGSNATALNIRLAKLLVPVAKEGIAKVVREAENEVDASNKNSRQPNSVRGTFDVISDARLDSASASNWYGAANPAIHDTVEVAYLDGNDRPVLEQQQGWSVDGTEFKVRIDAGVSPTDFRTLAKNPN